MSFPVKKKSSAWTRINLCKLPFSSYHMNNVRSIFDIHPGLELTKVLTHEYHFSDASDKPYTHLLSLQISPF